jgi:hypothetical protein
LAGDIDEVLDSSSKVAIVDLVGIQLNLTQALDG